MIESCVVKDLIERVQPSVAEVLVRKSGGWVKNGTGFAISASGLIATCHHVLNGWPEYAVSFGRGTHHEAKLRNAQPNHDLAIIEVEVATRPLALGSSDQTDVGKEVLWSGFPLYSWLLGFHKGMISYVGEIPIPGGNMVQGLQLDGTVNKGNSGGPIVDPDDGRVVGIVTSSLGSLDEALREALEAARATEGMVVSMKGGKTFDAPGMLIEVVADMERFIQLGVGYGISVDYLSALRREL